MSRRAWILFAFLAAFWGASYLFIKVALEDGVPPAAIVCARLSLAAVVLLPLAAQRGELGGLAGRLGDVAVLGAMQVAAPFLLITVGEQHLPSALTGILVATAPIFTFLLAFAIKGEERASTLSLVGVAIGIAGVALLLGLETDGGSAALLGGLMVVLASFGYGLGAWFLKRRLPDVQPVGLVAGTMTISALLTAPLLALDLPAASDFELDSIGALLALGVLGTGVSFVIFFTLIASEGPARASLVAYVAPAFSLIYGVSILDESFTAATAAGLVLIVGGSWMAAEGRLPWQARSVPVAPSG
jgi:drug/metabolite transporter (DMT)-like permease